MLPCSLLADFCFVFQRRQPTLDTQFWTRGFPWYCDLGRQASPLQHELGSGSSRYGRYVSRSRTEHFLSRKFFRSFSENYFSPRFSTFHATLGSLLADFLFVFQRRQPTLDTQFWTRGFPW